MSAFAFKDREGRILPVDEVSEKDDGTYVDASGEQVEQVVAKMSKSLRNVVNPDDVVEEYGVDTFRVYEMFMGPLGDGKPWNLVTCRARAGSWTTSGSSLSIPGARSRSARTC